MTIDTDKWVATPIANCFVLQKQIKLNILGVVKFNKNVFCDQVGQILNQTEIHLVFVCILPALKLF